MEIQKKILLGKVLPRVDFVKYRMLSSSKRHPNFVDNIIVCLIWLSTFDNDKIALHGDGLFAMIIVSCGVKITRDV